MSAFYVYQLNPEQFHAFTNTFTDLAQRNEEYITCSPGNTIYAWLHPEDMENRSRIVLSPEENVIYVLARTGRADWDFARWLTANQIPMNPPIQIYF